jgi:hypothetical protein
MRRFIDEAVRWISAEWNQGDMAETSARAGESESERRLREMQENGKTLFLP